MSTPLSMCLCLWVRVSQCGSDFSFISSCGCEFEYGVALGFFCLRWLNGSLVQLMAQSINDGSVPRPLFEFEYDSQGSKKRQTTRQTQTGSSQQAPSHHSRRRHFRPGEGGARTRHKTDLLGHCWRGGRVYLCTSPYLAGLLLRKHLIDNNLPKLLPLALIILNNFTKCEHNCWQWNVICKLKQNLMVTWMFGVKTTAGLRVKAAKSCVEC